MSQLKDGLIPKNTECPYISDCDPNGKKCPTIHKGLEHNVDFSCAIARGFDISYKRRLK